MLYLDILYHVFLILTILGAVFVFWGSNLEKEMVNQIIVDLIKKEIKHIPLSIPANVQKKLIETGIPSQCYTQRNISLFLILLSIFIVLLVATVLITIHAYYTSVPSEVTTVIIKNIVIFVFVALFELVFFSVVVLQYVPITEQEAKELIVNTIKNVL
jgi:hypothetical protein